MTHRFKESALKAFLCRATKSYSSFNLEVLQRMFSLEEKQVNQVASKMIIKGKIQAHIDIKQKMLIMDVKASEANELH